jgi:voltage-gated potassium channel
MPDAIAAGQAQTDATQLFEDLPRHQRRRLVLHGVVWTLVTVAAILIVYFVAPLDQGMSGVTILELTLLALVILGIFGWQIWRITKADFPTLRAVEALAFFVPAYLVFFAATYYLMNHANRSTFGTALTRLDTLYLSATVFTTVGFGDITAKTQAGRAVVLCQMVLDLVILGLVVRLVVNAVKISQRRRST